ncbi:MAG: hypothetical protein ACJ79J_00605 [Gemmatimonadaceae bacterium]
MTQSLRIAALITGLLLVGCSKEDSRLRAATPPPPPASGGGPDTTQTATDSARLASTGIGVWRGTSTCTKRPSACHDEIVVYRITRTTADSLSMDARKIVNGQEEEMGVIACDPTSGPRITCRMPNGTWHFTVRGDSLVGDLRLPDDSQFRDVRTVRSH